MVQVKLISVLHQLYKTGRFNDLIGLGKQELPKLKASEKDDAELLLGVAFLATKRAQEAEFYLKPLSERLPRADIFSNLGLVYQDLGKFAAAKQAFLAALALDPVSLAALSNLGGLLRDTRELADASVYLRRALELDPNNTHAIINLSMVERDRFNMDEAINVLRHGVGKFPDNPDIRSRLAITLLMTGKWLEAWPHYEVRLSPNLKKIDAVPLPDLPKPRWPQGKRVKRILLVGEQGLGDQLSFARLSETLAAGGMEVWLSVDRPLIPIMRTLPWVDRIIPRGTEKEAVKDCDAWEMLLSLPWRLGLTADNIPFSGPYLWSPPDMASKWREILGQSKKKRIGLVWRGRAENTLNERRSLTAENLIPLFKAGLPIEFISLQKDITSKELACFPGIREYGSQLGDFADTSGLLANLDGLITVDTSIAHLAGALGVKTYCLLSWVPDWRWGLKGDKTLWYPSMDLLRQEAPDAWSSLISKLQGMV